MPREERLVLRDIEAEPASRRPIEVMLFTDTLGDVNGVCRFIRDMGEQARAAGRSLRVVTSTRMAAPHRPWIVNFKPVAGCAMPRYENLELVLPPVARVLRHAARARPDVIHVSTPGPVGLCGLIAARMLRAPAIGVYHTDFPAYIERLFEDEACTRLASTTMRMFYRRFAAVLGRSEASLSALRALGVAPRHLAPLRPGVALHTFRPELRGPGIWAALGVPAESTKVLYVGRVSVEKNLALLTKAWPRARRAAAARQVEAELIVVGDGPYRPAMQEALRGEGAHFLGFRHGLELSRIYASSDLFVFPSMTDTHGQVALESQASGLPVLVSDRGGPKEVVGDGITGFVLPGTRPATWAEAMTKLLIDAPLRQRMGRSASLRSARFSLKACFEQFWEAHEAALRDAAPARAAARASRAAVAR